MTTGLETTLLGLTLEHPVMLGAGVCKLKDGDAGIEKFVRSSAASAITVGSITVKERPGNPGDTFYCDPGGLFTLNSLGLPNRGIEYYRHNLPEMVRMAHDAGKLLIVSVVGIDSLDEYAILTEVALEGGADIVEENLGCPNVWGEGDKQKGIASFDARVVGEILAKLTSRVGSEPQAMVKLSPFSDPVQRAEVIRTIDGFKLVKGVVSCNTVPNCFAFNPETGRQAISFSKGLAGLGGPAIKPISQGQVRELAELLPDFVDIVGVGGVTKGSDVEEYLELGCTAVQVVTACLVEGPKVFGRILSEMMGV